MRSLMIMIAIAGMFCSISAKQSYVVAKEENTSVYQNRLRKLYEQAVFTINPDEQVRVLKRSGRHIRIENKDQRKGWVEDKLVLPVVVSKEITYDPAAVEGYLNNPEPTIIWGSDGPYDYEIKLDRSFRDALRENVDKQTALRVTGR